MHQISLEIAVIIEHTREKQNFGGKNCISTSPTFNAGQSKQKKWEIILNTARRRGISVSANEGEAGR